MARGQQQARREERETFRRLGTTVRYKVRQRMAANIDVVM